MKTAPLTLLVLQLLTTSVIAQEKTEVSDPPDISVLEKSWSKKARYREWNQNPRADIRTPNEDLMREARDGKVRSGTLRTHLLECTEVQYLSEKERHFTRAEPRSWVTSYNEKRNKIRTESYDHKNNLSLITVHANQRAAFRFVLVRNICHLPADKSRVRDKAISELPYAVGVSKNTAHSITDCQRKQSKKADHIRRSF